MTTEGVTPDPSGYADRISELIKEWDGVSRKWLEVMPGLYASRNLYGLRDWEYPRFYTLEKLLVAQQQFNLMVVAAIDDLRKDLADRSS